MGLVDAYVKSPLSGIAPWVLLAVVSGPGRFEEAAAAALGLTVLTLWVGWRRGIPVHALEIFGAAFFVVLAALGLVASDDVIRWLETWAGEVSNLALAAFALASLVVRKPFTLAYARDTTPEEHWDAPQFLRINWAISAAWAAAFTFSAVVGAVGGFVGDGYEFWTGWILPIGALLFAVEFTEFYPDYAMARFAQQAGESGDPPASPLHLLDWLPPFVVVTGIAGWVSDVLPDAWGIGLIVAGSVAGALLRKAVTTKT